MSNGKRSALDKIANEIAACKVCRKNKTGAPVPGSGSSSAKVVLVGEAPGRKESQTGRPFVGSAGRILTSMLEKAGMSREEVFITSPVKFLPKHGTPTRNEVMHGMKHTWKQIEIIKPKVVVLMGKIACLGFLGRTCQISKEHGKIEQKDGIIYLLTFHPAAPLYSYSVKAELIKDFKKLRRVARQSHTRSRQ